MCGATGPSAAASSSCDDPGPDIDRPGAEEALRAAVRRFDDAASVARERVRTHGRDATRRSRETALRVIEIARARATADADRVAERLDDAVRSAVAASPGPVPEGALPAGRVRVRRVTPATERIDVPLLVPLGLGGGVRVVGRESDVPAVTALAGTLVARGLRAGAFAAEQVAIVNPRRRPLPAALADLPGIAVLRDGRELLRTVGEAGAGGITRRLIVLDHPHDLGLAGRRAVRAAACDPAFPFRLLLVHVAAEDSAVDLEHRRLAPPSWGVPHPPVACELWPARGGWRWPAHPELTVDLPTAPSVVAWPAGEDGRGHGPSAADREQAWRRYGEGLERLVAIARAHDHAVARAKRTERGELDAAAARRRRTLEEIATEERAVELQLRRLDGRPFERDPERTAAPVVTAVCGADARDLTGLRAARNAVVRAASRRSRSPVS